MTRVPARVPRTYFQAYPPPGYVWVFEHNDLRERMIEQTVGTGPDSGSREEDDNRTVRFPSVD